MPTHEVSFEIPKRLVFSKDVQFEVKSDGSKIGTLLISRGNVDWIPANNSFNKHRMPWERFARMMEKNGKKVRISG